MKSRVRGEAWAAFAAVMAVGVLLTTAVVALMALFGFW